MNLLTLNEYLTNFKIRCTDQQKAAMLQIDGPVNIVACPGSGKTTTIINRLGYMIFCMCINPENILALTYTRNAAAEMKERFISKFFPEPDNSDFLYDAPRIIKRAPTFSTINAFCAGVVFRTQSRHNLVRCSIPERHEMVFKAAVLAAYTKQNPEYPNDFTIRALQTYINNIKNSMLTKKEQINALEIDKSIGITDLYRLYTDYNSFLNEKYYIDFDDQMRLARKYLVKYPEELEFYRQRFPYILVDESQDTSKIQFSILKLLAADRGSGSPKVNLCIAGDDDQSIYGFRGAYPDGILNFEKDYPGAKTFFIETNFRSATGVVEGSLKLIKNNKKRFDKSMMPFRDDAGGIETIRHKTASMMYDSLFEEVKKDSAEGKKVGVLYRNNDSVIPLADLLSRNNISAVCRDKYSQFFDSPFVSDMLNMLRLVINPSDFSIFEKIYYKFDGLFLAKHRLENLQSIMEKKNLPVMDALAEMYETDDKKTAPADSSADTRKRENRQLAKVHSLRSIFRDARSMLPIKALHSLCKGTGYLRYIMQKNGDAESPYANLTRLATLKLLAGKCSSNSDFLQQVQTLSTGSINGRSNIHLSTIHSAKGLEYDKVIFIDPYEEVFSERTSSDEAAAEEARRLFFVAVTRARTELEFHLATDTHETTPTPSGFIREFYGISSEQKEMSAQSNIRKWYDSYNSNTTSSANSGKRTKIEPTATASDSTLSLQSKDKPVIHPGTAVQHRWFGKGTVISIDRNGMAKIQFANKKSQQLISLQAALDNKLIKLL